MTELAENAPVQESERKNKRRRRIVILCVVSLLNVGLVALILTQLLTPATNSVSDPLVGHPAPNFSLALLRPENGKSALSLLNFKGKAIVLNFWASWCAPCMEEAPILESGWKQMQAQGKDVIFLGIDYVAYNRFCSRMPCNLACILKRSRHESYRRKSMLQKHSAFIDFSVNDIQKAIEFLGRILRLEAKRDV